jgi:exopolyphosphatase/guanosine-5'-triphosphate,3'-diphosphate pyrophosphatase
MPEHLALLDLGSNAARFLLAEVGPLGEVRIVREDRAQTRLGAGPPGRLSRRAIRDTLDATHRFLRSARNGGPLRVVAIATAAVREAANRDRLLEPLRRWEGVQVEVLSGREEARLGAVAVLDALPVRSALVADLGGGSLQLTLVRDRQVRPLTTLPLGAVRLTRRFLTGDPPSPRQLRALRRKIREHLLGVLPPADRGETIVGLGGTVRALAKLARTRVSRRQRQGLVLARADVTAIRARLEALPLRKRRRLTGLKPERADIIVAGAVVLEELMLLGGYPTLTVCLAGVRDGVLLRETRDRGELR